jgi:hypothetical protein
MRLASKRDMVAVDRILNYVYNTRDYGLTFNGTGGVKLSMYADASYGSHVDRKSHYGIALFIGDRSAAIVAKSKKGKCMANSTTEAEYLALGEGAKLLAWARMFLKDLGFEQKEPTKVYEDNKSTIDMVNNGNDKGRTKHIDVKYHYIRELVKENKIKMIYKESAAMIADMLTKSVPYPIHEDLVFGLLGIPEILISRGSVVTTKKV